MLKLFVQLYSQYVVDLKVKLKEFGFRIWFFNYYKLFFIIVLIIFVNKSFFKIINIIEIIIYIFGIIFQLYVVLYCFKLIQFYNKLDLGKRKY